ncbi:MAG: hypothetical protein GY847_06645 [Proteobacteria bacterium]|nr:hypothetical protein [Pseudomonadota bacterium]
MNLIRLIKYVFVLTLILISANMLGCGDDSEDTDEQNTDEENGADTDIDTDTDTDIDADTDTDTDSDSDTDIDADSDSDSDTGSDVCDDGCVVDTTCHSNGEANPSNVCLTCDISVSTTAWSDNDDASCDDGLFCNGTDTCLGGTCSTNSGNPCVDDTLFCNGEESCDEENDSCVHSGNPCTGEDTCIEDEDQCCVPDVHDHTECNADGDVASYSSCNHELSVLEDCADTGGMCKDGICGCVPGLTGPNCSRCLVYVNGGLADYTDHDGSTWAMALNEIQEGISAATAGSCVVWVAAGTYFPTQEFGDVEDGGVAERYHSIQLVSGVDIYGGFSGNEIALEQRDISANPTVLDGDIDGNDLLDDGNVFHIVIGADDALIDGFTIQNGNANGVYPRSLGGGMYNECAAPSISNCTFQSNAAFWGGGGIYAVNTEDECGSPLITNCVFQENSGGLHGGGLCNYTKSNPTVTNCTFQENQAKQGGGMYNQSDSNPTVSNSVFQGNVAIEGGGMYNHDMSSPTLINCTFQGNEAILDDGNGSEGGGIYNNSDSNPIITNCILWGDIAETGPEIQNISNSNPVITYSDVQGLDPGIDDGNINADPLFTSTVEGAVNLRLLTSSPCIDAANDEVAPLTDKDENDRYDDPSTPNCTDAGVVTDAGTNPACDWIADMGAYEFR